MHGNLAFFTCLSLQQARYATDPVSKLGGHPHEALESAVAAVQDQASVTLQADVLLSGNAVAAA